MNLAQRIAQEFKTVRNDELTLKADQSSTYTKTETDSKIVELAPATDISGKADKATTYTKTEVDSAIPTNVSDLTNDSGFQTGSQVDSKIAVLTSLAPATLDTFKEIADQLVTDEGAVTALTSVVSNKVDKVTGKGLSTEDYTTVEKTKLGGIATGAQVNTVASVAGKTGVVALVKADVGLGNVDNTTDLLKPLSTAEIAALATKANLTSPIFTGTVQGITKAMVGLSNVDNTTDLLKPVSTATQTALNAKASTSAVTTSVNGLMIAADKTKLDGIAAGANAYALPVASTTVLGGVKAGTNIAINASGVISANDSSVAFTEITGKPTTLSGYGITDAYTKTQSDASLALKAEKNVTYTKTETDGRIQAIVGAAPAALDTLQEIAAQLANDESAVSALTGVVSTKADAASVYTKTEIDGKFNQYADANLSALTV
jgi:hypothetical protein